VSENALDFFIMIVFSVKNYFFLLNLTDGSSLDFAVSLSMLPAWRLLGICMTDSIKTNDPSYWEILCMCMD
jgi:hypothetical protein